jgi:hypothetical protein
MKSAPFLTTVSLAAFHCEWAGQAPAPALLPMQPWPLKSP